MKTIYYLFSLLVCSFLFHACVKKDPVVNFQTEPKLPEEVFDYSTLDPSWQINSSGLITDHGATLGRVLFYDTKLSANNRIACGSCHIQQAGFSDLKQFSKGFNNMVTPRNSMSISNMILMQGFFWDIRVSNLKDMVLMPVQNHIEMGMEDIDLLVKKLSKVDYYPPLFEAAFGTPEIDNDRISEAMAQFLRSMISLNAKFDHGVATGFANFTPMEKLGRDLFHNKASCSNCHDGKTFSATWGGQAVNIGLEMEYDDPGRGAFEPTFGNGTFKIPSLRNVEITGPYMHDGRFKTLEEVIDHYNEGVKNHPSLDWRLTEVDPTTNTVSPKRLNLDDTEKAALIAFLKTLTDEEFVKDIRFSDPFK